MRWRLWAIILTATMAATGCGTTKWSDSPRTATEQLLISDAVDRAISEVDFSALEDCSVFLDTRFIATTLDQNYVTSTLRQHMLASGCIIKDKPEDAEYVVEIRTGALGTNRNDVMIGVPATQLPNMGVLPTGAAAIPEIALSKRTSQQAVCKIAVFAYDRMTGQPVWQSGNRKVASSAKDTWLMGTGPFQRGNIYDGTSFAGEKIRPPLGRRNAELKTAANSSVGAERRFDLERENRLHDRGKVENAGYMAPLTQPPATAPGTPIDAEQPATSQEQPVEKTAEKPSPETGAAKENAVPAANTTAKAEPQPARPAYTPPVSSPATANPAGSGLQGELADQPIKPVTNAALTTANAINTYNMAKDLIDGK